MYRWLIIGLFLVFPTVAFASVCDLCHAGKGYKEDVANATVNIDDDDDAPAPVKKAVAKPEPTTGRTDRCLSYKQEVRRYVEFYLGINYPWHYQIGCMKQESNCREDIVSFDGGIGLFQLTPSTGILVDINKELGVIIDPYNPAQNIRAGVFYISKIYNNYSHYEKVSFGKKKVMISPKKYTDKCGTRLSDIYQFYNGGYWYYYESHKSGYSCERKTVRTFCTRGGAWVDEKHTKWLDFCEVNYDYPEQIYTYGERYKIVNAPDYKYW